jgi:predicted dehydrogenase
MDTNRRDLLKAAPLVLAANVFGANDRITYGMIGTGSRGRWLQGAFQRLGAQCVAVCDVYDPNLDQAQTISPGAKRYVNHKELLAQKDLDCVVIATPDHHHCPMLMDGLAAGKDVYLEKPLSMNLEESDKMIAAVRESKQVVQIGMHRRSMKFVCDAKKLIDDGALGKISMVKALWNWHFQMPLDNSPLPGKLDWERFQGAAPQRALEPRRFRWWRGFWDYSGGNMTDQGTHLMDVVQWMTNSGPPLSAVCQGKVIEAPGADVPNVFTAVFEFPEMLATWTLNYRSAYENDWSIQFQGEKGAMMLDRNGLRIYQDPGSSPTPWSMKDKMELVKTLPDVDKPEAHPQNFLDCMRSRQQPNCTVEIAAAAVAGPHMANLAFKQERRFKRA